ncbi:hypothetical protein HK101_001525 [Irineochytrium annulatum]|nr:hypothetical protein HK101_001525 [Irineochytrium annulatum]
MSDSDDDSDRPHVVDGDSDDSDMDLTDETDDEAMDLQINSSETDDPSDLENPGRLLRGGRRRGGRRAPAAADPPGRSPEREPVITLDSSSPVMSVRGDEGSAAAAEEDQLGEGGDDDVAPTIEARLSQKRCRPDTDEDLGDQECLICNEIWTSSGKHRVVSLKCGHLFGDKCIREWIRVQKKHAVCPTCRAKAKPSDVRPIFAQRLVAMDCGALDGVRVENKRLTEEVAEVRRELALAKANADRCLAELYRIRHPPFVKQFVHRISEGDTSRVGAFSAQRGLIFLSTFSSPMEHSLKVLDANDPNKHTLLGIHRGYVRDIKVSTNGTRILTASMDKTLNLQAVDEPAASIRFNLTAPGWSCCFDSLSENRVYAGLGNATVEIFDIRNASTALRSISNPLMAQKNIAVVGIIPFFSVIRYLHIYTYYKE